jgi:hypothetical protein
MLTRRDFVKRAAAVSVLTPSFLQGCEHWPLGSSFAKLPGQAWRELALAMKDGGNSHGSVALPKHPSFSALSLPRNIAYAHIRPQGVAICTDEKNVQTAIKWAVKHGIRPVARSPGAHSYAGYSMTNGLSLDLSALNQVSVDHKNGTATIGAGAMLGDVSNALAAEGRILPMGRCFSVGVTGYTLAGGFGFNARPYGMTCDSLVEAKVVTADGELVVCNEKQNADLFWALRGGNGGTFGINTSFTFRTQQGAPQMNVFRLRWSYPIQEKDRLAKVWSALQQCASKAPNQFSLRIGVDCKPCNSIEVEGLGQFYGSQDDLIDILQPALQLKPKHFIQNLDFASAGRYLLAVGAPNAFYTKSAFVDDDISEENLHKVLDWFQGLPCLARSASFTMFRWGGAIGNKAPEDTAFVHRSGQYLIDGTVRWRPGNSSVIINESKQWLNKGFAEEFNAFFNGSAFQSFIDRGQQDWQQAYYGNNFNRLQIVKTRWDPNNIFHNHQSIPPLIKG